MIAIIAVRFNIVVIINPYHVIICHLFNRMVMLIQAQILYNDFMHIFYIISYYLILYISTLLLGSQIVEFKPKRKWLCLTVILGFLMIPMLILCFTGFFVTGYESLPVYSYVGYIASFIPIFLWTSPGENRFRFLSYLYNWLLFFVICFLWNVALSTGFGCFVALFIPNIIPVRALFSFSEIYELILLVLIDTLVVIIGSFILRNLLKVFKKRIVFLLTNLLFLTPYLIPLLRVNNFVEHHFADYLSLLFFIFSFPSILLLVFITLRINDKIQLKKYYSQIEEKYKEQFEIYENYSEFFEESKKFRHDMINHLSVLSASIDNISSNKMITKAKETAESIIQDTRKINMVEYHPIPPVLNSLFSIKDQSAKDRNIDIIYQILLQEDINISNYDMVGIISNLLDNSIEACDKITAANKKKEIVLKLFNKNGFICIDISNSFNPEDNPLTNNFKTTKNNSVEHGFGSHIIASIIKKYNGYFKIKNENEHIVINIALSNS